VSPLSLFCGRKRFPRVPPNTSAPRLSGRPGSATACGMRWHRIGWTQLVSDTLSRARSDEASRKVATSSTPGAGSRLFSSACRRSGPAPGLGGYPPERLSDCSVRDRRVLAGLYGRKAQSHRASTPIWSSGILTGVRRERSRSPATAPDHALDSVGHSRGWSRPRTFGAIAYMPAVCRISLAAAACSTSRRMSQFTDLVDLAAAASVERCCWPTTSFFAPKETCSAEKAGLAEGEYHRSRQVDGPDGDSPPPRPRPRLVPHPARHPCNRAWGGRRHELLQGDLSRAGLARCLCGKDSA